MTNHAAIRKQEFLCVCFLFFFFQAEDGIRDVAVTGVQTCALPICTASLPTSTSPRLCVGYAGSAVRPMRVRTSRRGTGREGGSTGSPQAVHSQPASEDRKSVV